MRVAALAHVHGNAPAALLGPDVELRHTEYDVEAAVAQMGARDDLRVEPLVALMLEPPPRQGAIEHAEQLVFSD